MAKRSRSPERGDESAKRATGDVTGDVMAAVARSTEALLALPFVDRVVAGLPVANAPMSTVPLDSSYHLRKALAPLHAAQRSLPPRHPLLPWVCLLARQAEQLLDREDAPPLTGWPDDVNVMDSPGVVSFWLCQGGLGTEEAGAGLAETQQSLLGGMERRMEVLVSEGLGGSAPALLAAVVAFIGAAGTVLGPRERRGGAIAQSSIQILVAQAVVRRPPSLYRPFWERRCTRNRSLQSWQAHIAREAPSLGPTPSDMAEDVDVALGRAVAALDIETAAAPSVKGLADLVRLLRDADVAPASSFAPWETTIFSSPHQRLCVAGVKAVSDACLGCEREWLSLAAPIVAVRHECRSCFWGVEWPFEAADVALWVSSGERLQPAELGDRSPLTLQASRQVARDLCHVIQASVQTERPPLWELAALGSIVGTTRFRELLGSFPTSVALHPWMVTQCTGEEDSRKVLERALRVTSDHPEAMMIVHKWIELCAKYQPNILGPALMAVLTSSAEPDQALAAARKASGGRIEGSLVEALTSRSDATWWGRSSSLRSRALAASCGFVAIAHHHSEEDAIPLCVRLCWQSHAAWLGKTVATAADIERAVLERRLPELMRDSPTGRVLCPQLCLDYGTPHGAELRQALTILHESFASEMVRFRTNPLVGSLIEAALGAAPWSRPLWTCAALFEVDTTSIAQSALLACVPHPVSGYRPLTSLPLPQAAYWPHGWDEAAAVPRSRRVLSFGAVRARLAEGAQSNAQRAIRMAQQELQAKKTASLALSARLLGADRDLASVAEQLDRARASATRDAGPWESLQSEVEGIRSLELSD
jgi:hypothetical protein